MAFFGTSLEPSPRMGHWEYGQLLERGVRPLAEKEPYRVARILIEATASMIELNTHRGELGEHGSEDHSSIWCTRFDGATKTRRIPKKHLSTPWLLYAEKFLRENPSQLQA